MLAKKFVLASKVVGAPKLTDFILSEEALPTKLKDGEILAKAEWLSVDPYMRVRSMNTMPVGDQMPGSQVARVLKSRCPEFPEGCRVVGYFGWRDLTVYKVDPNGPRGYTTIYELPEMKGLPDSYALGCMGMPGNTALFGFLEICQPKADETVVVSAAGGAVGSLVGQIAKIKHCKVVGVAGTEDKLAWMKNELGFDHVINYKTCEDLDAVFKKVCPEGIDCYFDNVGGEFVYHVVHNMNDFGRISQCGSVSSYNKILDPNSLIMEPFDYPQFRTRQIKLEGFNVSGRWPNQWFDGIEQMRDWILEGKIKIRETITDGFEEMPQAFIDLLNGKNIGKQIIKA